MGCFGRVASGWRLPCQCDGGGDAPRVVGVDHELASTLKLTVRRSETGRIRALFSELLRMARQPKPNLNFLPSFSLPQ